MSLWTILSPSGFNLHSYIRLISLLLALTVACTCCVPTAVRAQTADSPDAGLAQNDLQRLAAEAATNRTGPAAPQPDSLKGSSINVLELLWQGGGIMAVIALVSLLVLAVAFERLFALRRGRLLPGGLRRELRRASDDSSSFVPQELFNASQRYRCAASRILQDMLQKLGRPVTEVETAIAEGTQREADYLYGNVRWLTLAAAITPLIGLLGTVWGMIIAFHDTTQLGAGSNRAEFLAEGIYVALVTTLGGLAVAIPAAVFAHYFEGRITKMLALIDGELRRLIPRFESQEGKSRYEIGSRGLVRHDPALAEQRQRAALATAASPLAAPPIRPSSRQK